MKTINNYITEKLQINMTSYTCQPKTREELRSIVRKRLDQDKNADLNDIDVSKITDMSRLFMGLDPHNINISEWDVSNVKDMGYMFYNCTHFNADISNWDVSKVENLYFMFYACLKFNCDLNEWNIDMGKVDIMDDMLTGCDSLKNIPTWYE